MLWESLQLSRRVGMRYGGTALRRVVSGCGEGVGIPVSVMFSVEDCPGALKTALESFSGVNMTRIESRPEYSYGRSNRLVNMHVDFHGSTNKLVEDAIAKLRNCPTTKSLRDIPWFPRKVDDLDSLAASTIQYGTELNADHPGFHDQEYRRRRVEITENARKYRSGEPIPRVPYTEREQLTWKTVYETLTALREKYACSDFKVAFRDLETGCSFSADQIPQLDDVSNYLKRQTGWTIRPVAGLLSPRNFLNSLAVRVFHSTQYIRHHAKPLYTPEPDICHEVLGHVPMFCDPAFAKFSQEIGLASLGAADEDIDRLARCYWFTVEFGVCKEGRDGPLKAYGAGILSSAGEIQHAFESGDAYIQPWNPYVAAETAYPITKYQPTYFVAEDFSSATTEFRDFAKETIQRPFEVFFSEELGQVCLA